MTACMLCCRGWVPGRGEAGEGPLPRLQQAHPAGAEHDSEGRGRLRTGFHPADQCGNYTVIEIFITKIDKLQMFENYFRMRRIRS